MAPDAVATTAMARSVRNPNTKKTMKAAEKQKPERYGAFEKRVAELGN